MCISAALQYYTENYGLDNRMDAGTFIKADTGNWQKAMDDRMALMALFEILL
jgi:hypothetical protein